MRRRPGGFLLAELTTAITIFCAVLLVLLFAISRAGELAAVNLERTQAASDLDKMLAEMRYAVARMNSNEIEKLRHATVTRRPDSDDPTRKKLIIKMDLWGPHKRLVKVTARVEWLSAAGGKRSMSATTLVRTKRLKLAGAGP